MPDNAGAGTQTLGEMLFQNDVSARSAAAEAISKPASEYQPVIPDTPKEAAARLSQIKSDPAWREAYLSGQPRHAKELRELQAIVDKENAGVDKALAGELYDSPIQPPGHMANIAAAAMLTEAGLRPDVVRQVLTGQPVSRAEYEAAKSRKTELMRDRKFVDAYMANNGPERQALTLLDVILSSRIKEDAAA